MSSCPGTLTAELHSAVLPLGRHSALVDMQSHSGSVMPLCYECFILFGD